MNDGYQQHAGTCGDSQYPCDVECQVKAASHLANVSCKQQIFKFKIPNEYTGKKDHKGSHRRVKFERKKKSPEELPRETPMLQCSHINFMQSKVMS